MNLKNSLRYTNHMPSKKIGYFGGTFDPPHIGHLILASEAADQFDLSRLYWVLTPDPPHKQEQKITPLEHRLAMLHSMVDDNQLFELSHLEIDRPGPHYTVDTLKLLAAQEPSAGIHLLIGGDSLSDLPTWRLSSDLVAAVSKIGVMRRPADLSDLPSIEKKLPGLTDKVVFIDLTDKVVFIDALINSVSSRELRRRIAEGQTYRYYVTEPVYKYIEAHHLYRESGTI